MTRYNLKKRSAQKEKTLFTLLEIRMIKNVKSEILMPSSTSTRNLPINIIEEDLKLFKHELKKEIPETVLFHPEDATVTSEGVIFYKNKIFSTSLPYPHHSNTWTGYKTKLKFFAKTLLAFKGRKSIDQESFWITDTWSQNYFHWMTDALPRLFAIRNKIRNASLLLPGNFKKIKYIEDSLKPFFLEDVTYIHEPVLCKNLKIPSHTAPTGNYNEHVIRGLRELYIDFHKNAQSGHTDDKIYISRGKAKKRKIVNEEACISVLKEYGFKTVYFEDLSFDQQVKIALNAKYMVSNHGAGLTNMLFMKSGSRILELRQKEDSHNNCYFALASALDLKYFYQTCKSKNPGEDANTANLIVDCQILRKTVEKVLAH